MVDLVLDAPACIKVGSAFCAILLLYRLGLSLGLSAFLSAVMLSAWAHRSVAAFGGQVIRFLGFDNILLFIAIVMLLFFTEALNRTGRMQRTVDALKQWVKHTRALYVGLPALVGLLPMPGGALFSAPLVHSVDADNTLDGPHKVALNYWFRHMWEYWWPLYPGVILAIRYTGLPAALYFALLFPMSIASFAGGYFFILRPIASDVRQAHERRFDPGLIVSALGPIFILVMVTVAGSVVLPYTGLDSAYVNLTALIAGLLCAYIPIARDDRKAFFGSFVMFARKKFWNLLVVVMGVQFFSIVIVFPLDSQGATLVWHMRDELISLGIPLLAVIVAIPFISGFITGIAFAFVGASFPLIFALIGENAPLNVTAATAVCAFVSGYVGMLLSPVHICFVVTNEYFKSRLLHSYRYLAGPCLVIFLAGVLLAGTYFLVL